LSEGVPKVGRRSLGFWVSGDQIWWLEKVIQVVVVRGGGSGFWSLQRELHC